jgi:hypothetical protein
LTGAGIGSLFIGAGAHAAYTRHLGMSETQTYNEPRPVEQVRPFMPTRNGSQTIRAGRFQLPAATWAALFETAEANGGRLTRDGAIKAGLPRDLYRDWQTTLGELQRLGIVDGNGQITEQGWRLQGNYYPPSPNGDGGFVRTSTHAPHARPAPGGEEWGE